MLRVIKEFPGPSVDNPALLGQFAGTLSERYKELFPPRRGFSVELEENTSRKMRSWEIRILHGKFGGARISIRPSSLTPQLVWVTVSATSRFEQKLIKVSAWLAVVLMAPTFIVATLQGIPSFLVWIPTVIVALILGMITMLLGRLFGRRDHHFDPGLRRRIMAMAGDLPLPTRLQRAEAPATVSSLAPSTLEAQPKRAGPSLFGD